MAGLLCEAGNDPARRSAAQAETRDDVLVALRRSVLQVVEKLAALIDHAQQAAARGVITLVSGEMLAELADARRQQRNLDFRGTRIASGALILRDDLAFLLARQ